MCLCINPNITDYSLITRNGPSQCSEMCVYIYIKRMLHSENFTIWKATTAFADLSTWSNKSSHLLRTLHLRCFENQTLQIVPGLFVCLRFYWLRRQLSGQRGCLLKRPTQSLVTSTTTSHQRPIVRGVVRHPRCHENMTTHLMSGTSGLKNVKYGEIQ